MIHLAKTNRLRASHIRIGREQKLCSAGQCSSMFVSIPAGRGGQTAILLESKCSFVVSFRSLFHGFVGYQMLRLKYSLLHDDRAT